MGTEFKPSQRRGKRLVYRSTDPDEPRRETIKLVKFLAIPAVALAALWLFSLMSR